MLSAGRAHQQARHVWIALGCCVNDYAALTCSRELSSLASGAATLAGEAHGVAASANDANLSRSHAACFSGRSEPASCGFSTGAVPSAALPGRPATASAAGLGGACRAGFLRTAHWPGVPAAAALPLGRRCYHPWYYGSKLRNRAILSISSLDQLTDLLRQNGEKLDHINLTLFLKQLQLLAAHAADQNTAAATRGTGAAQSSPSADGVPAGAAGAASRTLVAAGVAAASARAVEHQVQLLAAEAMRLVWGRRKWYDPRNAASVVYCTSALGYTDGRVLQDLTGSTMARLNEAYSRDLLLLLRGLDRHAKLSAAAAVAAKKAANTTAAAATTTQGAAAASSAAAQRAGAQPEDPTEAGKPWWQRARQPLRYTGPPVGLLEGVERFLLAKIPTGRVPPENVDGLLRHLRELPPGRPVGRELLATAETDLRRRLAIYAPEPLAGLLATLASERHPLPPDLLDLAANQFAATADKYGSGAAGARFLAAATALLRNRAGGDGSGRGGGGGGAGFPSPAGEWVASRPDLLAQCLRLMSKDLPSAKPGRLVAWMAVLNRAEVPLASLASVATAAVATAPPPSGPSPSASAPPPAPTSSISTAAAAAAAAFVRAHGAAVGSAAPRLSPDGAARLRKAYDTAGLPYPKGL